MSSERKIFNILVVEDNPGDFALVEEFLAEQKDIFNLFHAWNFKEAAEVLADDLPKFDVILLDLSLPDKTGLPLIDEIVALSSSTPVIVLTGYSDVAFGIKSLSSGVSDYILKDDLTPMSLYKSVIYSSERKNITSALRESEKQYSELFHLSPLPMYVFELESLKFLDVNEAFVKHYGYSRDELLSMNIKQIRPVSEIPVLERGLLDDSPYQKNENLGIYKHLKKDGGIIHVEIQSNFIHCQGKNAKVTIAIDVTEKLNYIEEIEEQNKKLREISWIQSHVVRAPLARLLGLVGLLKDVKIDGVENQKMLDYILISAGELDDIIKEITDMTRIATDEKYRKNGMSLQYENK